MSDSSDARAARWDAAKAALKGAQKPAQPQKGMSDEALRDYRRTTEKRRITKVRP